MTIWETGLTFANRFFEGVHWLVSCIPGCECISALFRQHVSDVVPVANPPPLPNVTVVELPPTPAPQPPVGAVAAVVNTIAQPVPPPAQTPPAPPPKNPNPAPIVEPFSLDVFAKPDTLETELDALKEWSSKNNVFWDNLCKVFEEDLRGGKLDAQKFSQTLNGRTNLNSSPYTIFYLLQTDAERLFEGRLKAWISSNKTTWYLAFNVFNAEVRALYLKEKDADQYKKKLAAAQAKIVTEQKRGRLNPIHFIPDRLIIAELSALHQASNNELDIQDMVASWIKDGTLCKKEQDGIRFYFPLFRGKERGIIADEFISQCKQEGIEASLQGYVENRNGTIVAVNDLSKIEKASAYQVVHVLPHTTGTDPNGKLNYLHLKKLVNKNRASINRIEGHFKKAFTVGQEAWSIKIQQLNPFKFKIIIPEESKNSVKLKYMIFCMFKELKINSHFFKDEKYVFDENLINKFDDFLTFSRINQKDQSLVLEVIENCFNIKDDFEERVASIAQIFGTDDVSIAYGSKPLTDFIPLNTPENEYLSRFQITHDLANQIKSEGGSIALPSAFQVRTTDDRIMVFLEVLYALTGVRAWNKGEKIFITETRQRGNTHCSNIDSAQMSQLIPVLDKILYAAGDDFVAPNHASVEQTINETFKALAKRLGEKVKELLRSSFEKQIDGELQAILNQLDNVATFKEVDVIKFNFLAKLVRTKYSLAADFWKSKSDEKQEENRKVLGTFELAQNDEILGKVLHFLGKRGEVNGKIKNWFKDSFEKLLPIDGILRELERGQDAGTLVTSFLTAQVRTKYGIAMDDHALLEKRKECVKKRADQIFLKFEETFFYKRANGAEFRTSYSNLKSTIYKGINGADKSDSYWGLPPVISGLDYMETFVSNADKLPQDTLNLIEQNFIASSDAWAGCQGGIQTKLVFLSTLSDGGQGIAEFTKQVEKSLQETFFHIKRKTAHFAAWYLEPDGAHGQKAIEVMAAEELGFQTGHIAKEDAQSLPRQETKAELVAFVKCALQPLESLVIPELKRNLLDIQEAKSKKQDPSPTLMLLGVPAAIEDNPFYDVILVRWNYEKIEQELPLLVIKSLIDQKLLVGKYDDGANIELFTKFLANYQKTAPKEFSTRTQRQEPIALPKVVGQIVPFKQTEQKNPVPNFAKMNNDLQKPVSSDQQYFSVDQEGKLLSAPLLGERADEKILLPLNFKTL